MGNRADKTLKPFASSLVGLWLWGLSPGLAAVSHCDALRGGSYLQLFPYGSQSAFLPDSLQLPLLLVLHRSHIFHASALLPQAHS